MKLWILIGALALGGCGAASGLKPQAGESLPPKPYGASTQPTPKDLQTPSPQARPRRSDELLKSSEQRRDDEFDLPPPG